MHSIESNASLATRVLSLALYHQVGAEQAADVFPLAAELGLRRLTELGENNSQVASGGEAASGPTGDDEAGGGAAEAAAAAAAAAEAGSSAEAGLVIVEVMEGPMSSPNLNP